MNEPAVYVSVPMAGTEDHGLKMARMIEDVVRSLRGEPVVPHDVTAWPHDGDCPPGYTISEGHSSACWLRGDLIELLQCDYVVLAPNWEHSVGCRLEASVAMHCGIPLLFFHVDGEIVNSSGGYLLDFMED